MRVMNRRWLAALAASAVAAVALVGSTVASAGGAKIPKNTFTMAIAAVPDNVSPNFYQGRPSSETYPIFTSPLIRFREPNCDDTQLLGPFAVRGYLAESYKREANGSYTFTLRDAKSPYGNTVSSEDVKWSFERMVATDAVARFLMTTANIDQKNPITIIDKKRFTLNVTAPGPLTLAVLVWYTMGINDSVEAKKHATPDDPWARTWLATHTATFGPYNLQSFAPAKAMFLTANPNYFGGKLPITRVAVNTVPDTQSRLQLILNGQVDHVGDLSWSQFKQATSSSDLRTDTSLDASLDVLIPSRAFKPFSDTRVLKALSMAIDREALIKASYSGFGKPALYPISSTIKVPTQPEPQKFDMAAAKALLAEAGYPNLSFTVTVTPVRPVNSVEIAQVLQAQLSKIGVTMKIDVVASSSEWEAGRRAKKYEATISNEKPIIADAVYAATLNFGSKGASNYGGYVNPKMDANIAAGLSTAPGPRFNRIVSSIAKFAASEFPWISLVETPTQSIFRKEVKGYICGYPNLTTAGVYVDTLSK